MPEPHCTCHNMIPLGQHEQKCPRYGQVERATPVSEGWKNLPGALLPPSDVERTLFEFTDDGDHWRVVDGPRPLGTGWQQWNATAKEWRSGIPTLHHLTRMILRADGEAQSLAARERSAREALDQMRAKHEAEVQTQYSLIAKHVAHIERLQAELEATAGRCLELRSIASREEQAASDWRERFREAKAELEAAERTVVQQAPAVSDYADAMAKWERSYYAEVNDHAVTRDALESLIRRWQFDAVRAAAGPTHA